MRRMIVLLLLVAFVAVAIGTARRCAARCGCVDGCACRDPASCTCGQPEEVSAAA